MKLTEAMVCPECGKAMEREYLTARNDIYWNEKVPRVIPSGTGLTKDVQPIFRYDYIRAYGCKECRNLRYFEGSKMWGK